MAEKSEDNPFSSPSTTSDVVLVVEDKKLHVSKAVLALMSPVFEKMFYGEFKEKNSAEVPLPGKKHDEMLEFLLRIYPTTLKPVTKRTVEAVMMLADEYQIQSIFDECVAFLTNENKRFKVSEMVHYLHLSEDKHQLKEVYDSFLYNVARSYNFKSKTNEDEFDELSPETRYSVLMKRVHLYESGEITYHSTFGR